MTSETPQIETLWMDDDEIWAALIIDPPADFSPPSREDFIKAVSLDLDGDGPDGGFPDVETHWVVRHDPAEGSGPQYWWGKEGDADAVKAFGMRF